MMSALWIVKYQKQPSGGVFKKICSENMQEIYRGTPMPKYDFNKVALQAYCNHASTWLFLCKFAAYFYNTLPKKSLGGCFWNILLRDLSLKKVCSALLFKFQWDIVKFLEESSLGPALTSMSLLEISLCLWYHKKWRYVIVT